LFDEHTKIYEGHNRHEAILRVIESLLRRNKGILTHEQIRKLSIEWNQIHCVPPLDGDAFARQWDDAVNFTEKSGPNIKNNKERNFSSGQNTTSKADRVVEALRPHYHGRLFRDEYDIPHVAINVNGHLETLPIDSNRFKDWITRMFFKEQSTVLDAGILTNVISFMRAEGKFNDDVKKSPLSLRVAHRREHGLLKWYYDLANDKWEFVEITSQGWTIKNNQILFRRFPTEGSQVHPSREYDPDIYDKFIDLLLNVNVKEENKKEYKLSLKCYIISLFIPEIPKVVFTPSGDKGAAKSTMLRTIKMQVDPSPIPILTLPKSENEFIQQLYHNYLSYYDNVSILNEWQSDVICRASTGGGSSMRELYTNDEDIIRNFKRCVALNGINLAATKPDLLDRSLITTHTQIQDKDNKTEEEIAQKYEEIRPYVLGYILDILVKVLRFKEQNPNFKLDRYPRMADFAEYGEIISRCMGYPQNEFYNSYINNIKSQSEQVIDTDSVASVLVHFMFVKYEDMARWEGTMTSLYSELELVAEEIKISTTGKFWPKTPSRLARRINEIKQNLREMGLHIDKDRDDKTRSRIIKIVKVPFMQFVPSEEQITTNTNNGNNVTFQDLTFSCNNDKIK
jgi:hypothetical protein